MNNIFQTMSCVASAGGQVIARRAAFVAALLSLLLAGCGGVSSEAPDGEFVAPIVEYRLVFEDDFEGATLDTTKWSVATGDGCPDSCGWGNNELQVFSEDNVSLVGGMLRIEGREELDGSFTSGRVDTAGKFDFRYGRVEISARIPGGQGIWPSIRMQHSPAGDLNPKYPDLGIYGATPLSGEIDIMEAFNYGVDGNDQVLSTMTYGLPTPPFSGTSGTTDLATAADQTFHEYAVEWERGRVRFFIDGQHFQTQIVDEYYTYYPANSDGFYDPFGPYRLGLENEPFDQAFHLLLNFAIGGDAVGAPDASTVFPQIMEIDYVRVYECANANPGTGRGCGTADPSVQPLEDLDGGPLESLTTAKPYIESVDLFLDGPEAITVSVGADTGTNNLAIDGFTGDNATVTSDPAFQDPDDPANTVWYVSIADDVANVYIASEDLTDDEILDTGFDFSGSGLGGDPVGEIVFDMQVNAIDPTTDIIIKLDSGFPNVGEVVIPQSELAIGEWKSYSVKFEDLLANPGFVDCCGGQGVNLENVVNPFVLEVVNGSADLYLDNIGITNACYVVGGCGAAPRTKGIADLVVFDDTTNIGVWNTGIAAADSGSGFANYTDGTNPANKANWAIIDDADTARGQVIDVTFNDSGEFGVWFIQSTGAVDMRAYAAGAVVFDIIVDDYGNNTNGMTMKIDCFFPCTSGDKNLGVIADGVWETITIPVASLTSTGLDLSAVNTGIVVFPTSQSGTIRFRLDNIRWVAETDAAPLGRVNLPVTFEDAGVNYALTDFGGAASELVTDPVDTENTVASTTKAAGAATFAGTVIGGDAGFENAIPFMSGATDMSVRVYSPTAGTPVLLKVETDDASVFSEVIVNTTVANEWETLVFDFASVGIDVAQAYTRAIIFFDFGQDGNDATYFWDDLVFGDGSVVLSQIDLPVTFDEAGVDYTVIDFEGTQTTLGMDPDNMSNNVAITVKNAGQPFAGTVVGDGSGFATPIPISDVDTVMSLRVRSPAANIPVMLKIENADGSVFSEVIVNTTVADMWETLTFDFSTVSIDTSATYVQAIVFFDFNTNGSGETYYWDDLQFVPTPPTAPFRVFDDTTDAAWPVGLAGVDSASGFARETDSANLPVVDFAIVAAADTARGDVVEATIGGVAGQFGLMFFAADAPGNNLTAYADGAVVFDIFVSDYDTNTNGMIMKIDCGFPCTSGDTPIGVVGDGVWQTVSVPVSTLVGTGLSLTTVDTGLVIFPDVGDQQAGAAVTFQVDNVRWEPEVVPEQGVFSDVVDAAWPVGLAGVDSASGFARQTDPANLPVIDFAIVAAADTARGDVVEATIGGVAGQFGLIFFAADAPGNDLGDYDEGAVVFDIFVSDYDTNTNGMIMKIDCGFPCTSGDTPIGVVGDGAWQTVSIEVSALVASGLSLATVDTGLVIFPDVADQQAGATVTFQLDNVRWER